MSVGERGWQPSESDLQWTRRLTSLIKDGGMWVTSFCCYRVYRSRKEIVAQVFSDTEDFRHNHGRVKVVFERIGWTVHIIN